MPCQESYVILIMYGTIMETHKYYNVMQLAPTPIHRKIVIYDNFMYNYILGS